MAEDELCRRQGDQREDVSAETVSQEQMARWFSFPSILYTAEHTFLIFSEIPEVLCVCVYVSLCEMCTPFKFFNATFIEDLSDACSVTDKGSANIYFSYCQQIP